VAPNGGPGGAPVRAVEVNMLEVITFVTEKLLAAEVAPPEADAAGAVDADVAVGVAEVAVAVVRGGRRLPRASILLDTSVPERAMREVKGVVNDVD
jgi:hypothetical protein